MINVLIHYFLSDQFFKIKLWEVQRSFEFFLLILYDIIFNLNEIQNKIF